MQRTQNDHVGALAHSTWATAERQESPQKTQVPLQKLTKKKKDSQPLHDLVLCHVRQLQKLMKKKKTQPLLVAAAPAAVAVAAVEWHIQEWHRQKPKLAWQLHDRDHARQMDWAAHSLHKTIEDFKKNKKEIEE